MLIAYPLKGGQCSRRRAGHAPLSAEGGKALCGAKGNIMEDMEVMEVDMEDMVVMDIISKANRKINCY